MAKALALFCEDRGHEQYVRALVARLSQQIDMDLSVSVPSARGGHGAAATQFEAWQSALGRGLAVGTPDLLVLVIDGNCQGWHPARQALGRKIDPNVFPRSLVACPDPHIERWCLADPDAFQAVIGAAAPTDPEKCERNLYKEILRNAILAAGQPILTDAMEYAPDLVARADLYKAGKAQPSLGAFIDALRAALNELASASQ
jgi:hypothetical protein